MKSFLQEVSLGLSKKNKKLSSKWFYDFHGSKLFEQITKLEEYYPTRTERKILKGNLLFSEKSYPFGVIATFGNFFLKP